MTPYDLQHQFPRSTFEETPSYRRNPFMFIGEDPDFPGQVIVAEYGLGHPNLVVRYPKDAPPTRYWKDYHFTIDSWGKSDGELGSEYFKCEGRKDVDHYVANIRFGKFYPGGVTGNPPVFEYTNPKDATHVLYRFSDERIELKFDFRTPVVYGKKVNWDDMSSQKFDFNFGRPREVPYYVLDIRAVKDEFYLIGNEGINGRRVYFHWRRVIDKGQELYETGEHCIEAKIIDDRDLPPTVKMSDAVLSLMESKHPVLTEAWAEEYHKLYTHEGIEEELVIHPMIYCGPKAGEYVRTPTLQFQLFSTVKCDMIRDVERGRAWTVDLYKDGLQRMYEGLKAWEEEERNWLRSIYLQICTKFPDYYDLYT